MWLLLLLDLYWSLFKQNLILMLSPLAPHLAEELWSIIGNKNSVFNEKWPKYNKNHARAVNEVIVSNQLFAAEKVRKNPNGLEAV